MVEQDIADIPSHTERNSFWYLISHKVIVCLPHRGSCASASDGSKLLKEEDISLKKYLVMINREHQFSQG